MTSGPPELVGADDVLTVVDGLAAALDTPAERDDDPRWDAPAAHIDWTCRYTLAHVADCVTWYAALLARRATTFVEVAENSPTAKAVLLVDSLRSGAVLLDAVLRTTPPETRAYHAFGMADRSGFAAMACDETLVHGADIAEILGVAYVPPLDVVARVVQRLFPWVTVGDDPWAALQFANGRAPLGDEQPRKKWKWHCAPLEEWDGKPAA